MRAVCESCSKPQPPDWKAGDLCVSCGNAVRREVRCFWCVKWVPAGKFCRACGAVVVDEARFGAARMLKDAGSDRFTIPKQLVEFPPDQIENFSRIYQRHAMAVARHVEEPRFLERFLRQQLWSAALEDELIPQLPWPEARLELMSRPTTAAAGDLATVLAIQQSTPIDASRSLASLARLRLQDDSAYQEVVGIVQGGDPGMRLEAALALGTWRISTLHGYDRSLGRVLAAELAHATFTLPAAVARGFLGDLDRDLVRQALTSPEGEVSVGAALLLGDLDRLTVVLQGDDLSRIAAGRAIIALGHYALVAAALADSTEAVQTALLEGLVRRKEAMPELGEVLLRLLESSGSKTIRERSARLLCRQLRPEWAERIARAAQGEQYIFQSLMSTEAALPADALSGVLSFMIEHGFFTDHQYGLMEVAKRGGVAETFICRPFGAAGNETRKALLRFAEEQLKARGDDELHRFVMATVFGPYPAEIRAAGWWVLSRWYRQQGDHRGEGPLRLTVPAVQRFFGSMADFLPKLAALIGDHASMKEVGLFEFVATLLSSADDAAVAAIQDEPAAADQLVAVLLEAVALDYWPNTREAMINVLSRIGTGDRWRTLIQGHLAGVAMRGNYHYDQAMRRLELSAHGIPEEARWKDLPAGFVPAHFASLDAAGQRELLKLAEHQLIHAADGVPDAQLHRFLLVVAMRPGADDVRIMAMHLYQERFPRGTATVICTAPSIQAGFGTVAEFLDLAPALLGKLELLADRIMVEFLSTLFDVQDPSKGAFLVAAGKSGVALVSALLEVVAIKGGIPALGRLRRTILRYLAQIGGQPIWSSLVVAGLKTLLNDTSFDLRSEGTYALGQVERMRPSTSG